MEMHIYLLYTCDIHNHVQVRVFAFTTTTHSGTKVLIQAEFDDEENNYNIKLILLIVLSLLEINNGRKTIQLYKQRLIWYLHCKICKSTQCRPNLQKIIFGKNYMFLVNFFSQKY